MPVTQGWEQSQEDPKISLINQSIQQASSDSVRDPTSREWGRKRHILIMWAFSSWLNVFGGLLAPVFSGSLPWACHGALGGLQTSPSVLMLKFHCSPTPKHWPQFLLVLFATSILTHRLLPVPFGVSSVLTFVVPNSVFLFLGIQPRKPPPSLWVLI